MSTVSIALNATGWVSLGSGPFELQVQGSVPVLVAFGSSAPAVGGPAETILPRDDLDTRTFNVSLPGWGMCVPGYPATFVTVTPVAASGGGGVSAKTSGDTNAANAGLPISVGPSSPTLLVAARAGRSDVTFLLETSTPIRFSTTSAGVSATKGALLSPTVNGAAITLNGESAWWAQAPAGTATVSVVEIF